MSAEDAITHKIGPLPAWAWAGSVVALVLLFRYWQGRNADAATTDVPEDPGTDLTDPANDPAVGDPFAGGGFTGTPGTSDGGVSSTDLTDALGGILDAISGTSDQLTDIGNMIGDDQGGDGNAPHKPKHTTKAQWGMHAVDSVSGHGHSPVEVETAMWKYLHGKPLTKEERQIVNIAIRKEGPPPGGVIRLVHPPKPVGHDKDHHHAKKAAPKKKPPHRKAG